VLRAVAEDASAQARDQLLRPRQRPDEGGHLLLGDLAAGEDDDQVGGEGRGPRRSRVLAFEHARLSPEPELAEPLRVEPREAERGLPDTGTPALDPPADHARAAEVLAPVVARPDLVPVDHQTMAPQERGR